MVKIFSPNRICCTRSLQDLCKNDPATIQRKLGKSVVYNIPSAVLKQNSYHLQTLSKECTTCMTSLVEFASSGVKGVFAKA